MGFQPGRHLHAEETHLKLIYEGRITLHVRDDGRKVILSSPLNMEVNTCLEIAAYFMAMASINTPEGWGHGMRTIIRLAEAIRANDELIPVPSIRYELKTNWPGW